MITRIVRMEFREEKVEEFLDIFRSSMNLIRSFEGVQKLELHRDAELKNVFYTISEWRSQEDLENYRNSELFSEVWTKTKALFKEKASAWSLEGEIEVKGN